MKIGLPHGLAKNGQVDLIGNPVKFSKTPVTYPGAHTEEVLRDLLADEPAQPTDGSAQ